MKYRFRLAVQGKRNFTPIGTAYETLGKAISSAGQINASRIAAGLKPAVAVKEYRASRWQFLCWLPDDEDQASDSQASAVLDTLNARADELAKPHNGELGNQWRSLDYSDVAHLLTKDQLRKARFETPITIHEGTGDFAILFPSPNIASQANAETAGLPDEATSAPCHHRPSCASAFPRTSGKLDQALTEARNSGQLDQATRALDQANASLPNLLIALFITGD